MYLGTGRKHSLEIVTSKLHKLTRLNETHGIRSRWSRTKAKPEYGSGRNTGVFSLHAIWNYIEPVLMMFRMQSFSCIINTGTYL